MNEFDYWRLADTFSLVDAAALICGIPPSEITARGDGTFAYIADDESDTRGKNFKAALKSMINSVNAGNLKTVSMAYLNTFMYSPTGSPYSGMVEVAKVHDIDPGNTLVGESSLKEWLSSRGFKTGFFLPEGETADYLTKEHPKYAPKLAACVKAWQYAIKLPDNGKTPKQNIDKWLREHAAEFGMTDPDGRPIESAIEQCSKVANWDTKGGAPKTP